MSILLQSLSYQTIERGGLAGFLAFVLELGGGKSPSISPIDILKEIDSLKFKTNHVRIRGVRSTGQKDIEGDLFALVRALLNRNMAVSLEHPAEFYPSWGRDIPYKIAIATSPRILGTEARELWYVLTSLDRPDIDLSKIPFAKVPILYLDIQSGEIGVVALSKWVQKSKYNWAILPKPTMNYRTKIL